LTYDKSLIATDPSKFLYYAIGGCWIAPQQRVIAPKTQLASMIASAKNSTPGHKLRHEIAARLGDKLTVLGGIRQPIKEKGEGLLPYHFSVAVENCQIDDYFTEKIVDCFVTGTVPVYWGTRQISSYFNPKGILQFETVDELEAKISQLTPALYESLRPYVEENYRLAQNYLVAEDWIYERFPFLFV